MGLLTILKKVKQRERELRILILGLDNAGKTTGEFCRHFDGLVVIHSLPLNSRQLMHQGKTELLSKSKIYTHHVSAVMKRVSGENIQEISPTVGFNIKRFERSPLFNRILNSVS